MFLYVESTWALLQGMNRIVCEIKLKVVIAFFFYILYQIILGNEWRKKKNAKTYLIVRQLYCWYQVTI